MFGKNLDNFGSKLFDGPLGVVQIGFAGYNLGKTSQDSKLKPDLDIKDINYQQEGTKPADHVITGADWILDTVFAEIKTELLKVMFPYLVASQGSSGNDSAAFKADLYKSMVENYANVLKVGAVNASGVPSEEVEDLMYFYKVIPVVNGDLINWGADTQRELPVQFKIKRKIFTTQESSTHESAHGYMGDPTVEDLPAANWPDLAAPQLTTVEATAATTVVTTWNKDLVAISGVTLANRFRVKVEEDFITPSDVSIGTDPNENIVTLTLPASSISAGDVVELYIGAGTVKDSSDNENEEYNSYLVTNSVT